MYCANCGKEISHSGGIPYCCIECGKIALVNSWKPATHFRGSESRGRPRK